MTLCHFPQTAGVVFPSEIVVHPFSKEGSQNQPEGCRATVVQEKDFVFSFQETQVLT